MVVTGAVEYSIPFLYSCLFYTVGISSLFFFKSSPGDFIGHHTSQVSSPESLGTGITQGPFPAVSHPLSSLSSCRDVATGSHNQSVLHNSCLLPGNLPRARQPSLRFWAGGRSLTCWPLSPPALPEGDLWLVRGVGSRHLLNKKLLCSWE